MFDHDTEDDSSCVGSRTRRAETAGGVNWKRGNPCGSIPLSRADLNTEIFGLFCEEYHAAGNGVQEERVLVTNLLSPFLSLFINEAAGKPLNDAVDRFDGNENKGCELITIVGTN